MTLISLGETLKHQNPKNYDLRTLLLDSHARLARVRFLVNGLDKSENKRWKRSTFRLAVIAWMEGVRSANSLVRRTRKGQNETKNILNVSVNVVVSGRAWL